MVTLHINECSQWSTALRQLIFFADSNESDQDNQSAPAQLPESEMNIVQLLNVSSMPSVIDANTSFPLDNTLISTTAPAHEPRTDDSAPINPISEEQTSSETNKPKSGRFGRILHL